MLVKIESLYQTTKDYNEDYIRYDTNHAIILDGASPLIKLKNSNYICSKFVEIIGEELSKRILNGNINLKQVLNLSMESVLNSKMADEFIKQDMSASICILRNIKDKLELYYLGDCSIYILRNDFYRFRQDFVEKFDRKVIDNMILIHKDEKISIKNTMKNDKIKNLLLNNRNSKNTKVGYPILDTSLKGINYGKEISLDACDYDKILMCSDGFDRIFDLFKIIDAKTFVSTFRKKDLELYYDKMKSMSTEDDNYNRFPRFNSVDDTSAMFFEVSKD